MLFLTISILARFVILLYCFRGTCKGDKDEEPFREAFANIEELRSICPKANLLALTATSGPSQRRRIMKMLCFRSNSDILDSTDRGNIKIPSVCIPYSDNFEKSFQMTN